MPYRTDNYIVFTLEEFLKKYPYKVGDKAIAFGNECKIIGAKWDETIDEVVYRIKLECGYITTKLSSQLQSYKEQETKNVFTEFFDKYCKKCGSQRCTADGEWLEECKYYKEYNKEEPMEKENLNGGCSTFPEYEK